METVLLGARTGPGMRREPEAVCAQGPKLSRDVDRDVDRDGAQSPAERGAGVERKGIATPSTARGPAKVTAPSLLTVPCLPGWRSETVNRPEVPQGVPPLATQGGVGVEAHTQDGVEEPDEAVLIRMQAGEPAALSELWSRYAALLYTQALKVLHNPVETEDVVVEVFSEVWQRAAAYHPERARPVAWLVTLARRRAIDRLRERRSYERAEARMALECGRRHAATGDCCEECTNDGPEEQVGLAELRLLLEQALSHLPEPQKQTVCMVYFQGLTQKEIAEKTRTPLGTVKTRLELGLRKMRDRIRSPSACSLMFEHGS